MMSVGYDMYLKLLEDAVLEERGEERAKEPECVADLSVTANIPEKYVASAEQRMDLYRRIALIRTEDDADDLTDELIDRFGDPPASVNALIHVALMRGDLRDVVTAIRLSRAVMRNIRLNLFWAFFYNVLGIPIAAGALYPAFGWQLSPMLGTAAMACSSLFVVTNALRLRKFR